MKEYILVICLFLGVYVANAQNKVKPVSDKYNRSSVSYVFIDRTQTHAQDVNKFYETYLDSISHKFDVNNIATKMIRIDCEQGKHASIWKIAPAINENKLGNEIISYIFNRKEDGSFDDKILLERGRYNAKDQDVRNLEAAKVKDITLEWGEPLVNTAYLIVYDIYNTSITKDKKGNKEYKAEAQAYAFKLKADREVLDEFYSTTWVDADATDAEKAKAAEAFDKMVFEMEYVTQAGASCTSNAENGNIYNRCVEAFNAITYQLENKINAWQVNTSIVSVRPLAAKIGKKEGLKNGDLYQAYSYAEDKNGELISVKHGMVRATVISNNIGEATGNTKPSLFYQISGFKNIKEGYVLQEIKNIFIGTSLTAGYSTAFGYRIGCDNDLITHIGKRGAINYAMFNVGYNRKFGPEKDKGKIDAMVGWGYGIPLTRFFEITPYAMIGGLLDIETGDIADTFVVEPGIRFAVTLQPWSIFVNASYQRLFGEGSGHNPGIKFGIKRTW